MQYDERPTLPQPDTLSEAHSRRVAGFIHERIASVGGSISFAEFMQHALYAPGLGYYVAGNRKFGADGDFVTAPEISTLFGRVLARQCVEVLGRGGSIVEYGAGSGKLAADLLGALGEFDALPERYDIVEVSADLRERQQRFLERQIPDLVSLVHWVDQPPAAVRGVIVANEVLDAMPVERFRRTADGIAQLHVASEAEGFAVVEAAAPPRLVDAVQKIEQALGQALAHGYVSEVSLALPHWIDELGLAEGIAFLFDYGVSRREYYAPERDTGWLRCRFRQRAHDDALIMPGIQDITAWVDFTSVAESAIDAGFDVAGYTSQSHFLAGGGLDVELAGLDAMPARERLELASQVKTLTLPGEMGERFKCRALRRGDVEVPSAFRLADRTHTL